MRRSFWLTLTACAAVAFLWHAAEPRPGRAADKDKPIAPSKNDVRARVLAFLKDHAAGKTLAGDPTTAKVGEKLESDFSRRVTFGNLTETANGLTIDATTIVTETVYDLDDKGKRVAPGRVKNRVVVTRYELKELESVPRLVGLSRMVSNSTVDAAGTGWSLQAEFKDDKLVWTESTLLVEDLFGPGGKSRPGAMVAVSEFSLADGKLQRAQTVNLFDVDPDTLKRTPSGEPAKLVDKQVD